MILLMLAEAILLPYIMVSPTWAISEKLSIGEGVVPVSFHPSDLPYPTKLLGSGKPVGFGNPIKT